MAATKAELAFISREFQALSRFKRELAIRDSMPEPIGLFSEGDCTVATHQYMRGRPFPLRRYLADPGSRWAADASSKYMSSVALLSERLPALNGREASARGEEWLSKWMPTTDARELSTTLKWQHGDPMISNCLNYKGEMRIIDFEHASVCPEWFDVAYTPVATLFLLEKREPSSITRRLDELLRAGRFMDSIAAVCRRHRGFDVPPATAWPAAARLAATRQEVENGGPAEGWRAVASALEDKRATSYLDRLI